MTESPNEQGNLDTLCGLYALINTLQLLSNIDEDKCGRLFKKGILHLESSKRLIRALTQGICKETISELIKEIAPRNIKFETPFSRNNLTVDQIWNDYSSFLEKENRAILVCIRGKELNHWTVIKSITQKQMQLYDSAGYSKLNKRKFTTKTETIEQPYLLKPTYTFYISNA